MPISSKQKKTLTEWMKAHNVRPECPACGEKSGWQVHESIIAGLDLDLKNKKAKPSTAGFFALACKNCYYVNLFAAAPILGK